MIRSFADRETEQIFNRRHGRRHAALERIAFRWLRQIHSVSTVEELCELPGNSLEKPNGGRGGRWSLRSERQLRICFRWSDGDAYEVQIVERC